MTPSALPHKNVFILLALAGSVLLASLGISIASVALPTLTKVFSAPISSIQWVVLGYLMAVTLTIVFAGRCGDVWGHRRVLIFGLVLFTLASIACAFANSLTQLIIYRMIQGCAAAILMALPMSLIREVVDKERTGAAMGLLGTVSALGTALGPSLGGVLIEKSGWQAAFLLLAGISAVIFAMAWSALPTRNTPRGEVAFIPWSALRNPQIASSLVANFMVTTILMSTLVVGPFFLFFGLTLSQSMVGVVMAVGPVTSALFGIPAGRLTDKFGTSRMALFGLVQVTISLIGLACLPRFFGAWGYIVSLMLLTPGFQLFLAANSTAVMLASKEQHLGIMSGLLGVSRNLGFMSGASLMATLFGVALGGKEIATLSVAVIGDAFSITFLIAAAMALITIGVFILGRSNSAAAYE